MRGPSNNALLSLDLEDHLYDLGVMNKFIDFYLVIYFTEKHEGDVN